MSRGMLVRAGLCAGLATGLAAGLVGCQRPPVTAVASGPTRIHVLDPAYGADPEHPEALAPGDALVDARLALADGGTFELDEALGAGPVVLVWIGGAEHEGLTAWARGLDAGLAQLDARATTLVFVRPLETDAALRWAVELGLRSAVVADAADEFWALAQLRGARSTIDFAIYVLDAGEVVYRKLGARQPQLDELLAVIDDEASSLRCCPAVCVGEPCE